MGRIKRVTLNLIFSIQVLLFFFLFVEDRIHLPAWLAVAGRMHPLVLHLPIGVAVFLMIFIVIQRELDKTIKHQMVHLALLFISLSASVTALFGFFLSVQSEYGVDALTRHRISGVLLSFLCYAVLVWHSDNRSKQVFMGLGILSCLVLVFAGHTGAVLTHGEDFVFAPMKSKVILTAENASLYKFAVEPILERKCFSCHNESKAKGGLIMTSADEFRTGGDNGKPWVEGKPNESRMIKAFYLPLSHDEHMPPDGRPQLTEPEIATVKAWIKSGADFEKKLNQFSDVDSLKIVLADLAAATPLAPLEKQYTFSSVSDEVILKLNTPYRTVSRLYQNSPALQADFFVRSSFETKALEELKTIKDQLVVLNLSKMPVTDKDLSMIKSFKNLEHLNLNFSSIQGDGLVELGSLKNLKSISLSGTAIEIDKITPLLALPELTDIFVWGTKLNADKLLSLSNQYPAVSIVNTQYRDESILKLNKPILDIGDVIRKGEETALKHPMTEVIIYYTLDGTDPDTLNGKVYHDAFKFEETVVVKARACKEDWFCSDVFEATCFVEGLKPTHTELLNAPDPKYPGEGAPGVLDHRKGFADVLNEPSWLGYRYQPFAAGFDFEGQTVALKGIVISYAKNIGAFSFPPEEVEVWAGDNKDQLSLIKRMTVEQPKKNQPLRVEALSIPLEPKPYLYYKVIAKPVAKLPQWHSGKGEKGWVFIDEMFFY
jgi:hypothetical protein